MSTDNDSLPTKWTKELENELAALKRREAQGYMFDPEIHRMFKLINIRNNWRVHEVMQYVRRGTRKEKPKATKKGNCRAPRKPVLQRNARRVER